MSYTLKDLPYDYNALEPHIDEQTMKIHHDLHHQGYVNKLNNAIEGTEAENEDLETTLQNISKYSTGVRNNGGGHYNHSLFWKVLSGNPKKAPEGKLSEEINKTFGSLEKLKEQFTEAAATQFGSGWAWLFVKHNGSIGVCSTPNQDNPLMDTNSTNRGFPIMGVDVWEHAYYLKYQNKRPDYLNAFWEVLDWNVVEKNYEEALLKVK